MHRSRLAAPVATLIVSLSVLAGPAVAADPSGLPPLADVPEYRANTYRNGQYPGPGPVAEPVLVWSRTIDAPISFNPILADGLLLFGGQNNTFYALDARTGIERWRFGAEGVFNVWGSAADGTLVAASDDGMLHALDLATGTERWSHPGIAAGTGIIDGVVYAPGTDDAVYGLDLATGEQVWSWTAPAAVGYVTVADGIVYASVGDGRLYAIAIADGTERWHVQTIAELPRVAEIDGDTVVASGATTETPTGELMAIDRNSGNVRWRFRTPTGYMITAGSMADGVVYAGGWDRSGLYAFSTRADPSSAAPQPLWHTQIDARAFKNEAISGDLLYVPTEDPDEILAVSAGDGAIRWRLPQTGTPNAPLVSGGMLFTSDPSGTIAAWAEPAIRDAIGSVGSGPLGEARADVQPPNPFTVLDTLEPSTTGLQTMLAMDIGPDGLIYALDMKPSVTVIDAATGNAVRAWGRQGTGDGEFDLRASDGNPGYGDIAVSPDGTVFVADSGNHRLQAFTPDGTFVRQLGSFGKEPGQFSRPFFVATDREGGVYTVDSDLRTLTKFDADGALAWSAHGPDSAMAVVALPDGRIAWTGDFAPVLILDPATGAVVDQWGVTGRDPGELSANCEVAVDKVGNEYIYGCEPSRMQVFGPDHQLIAGAYAPRDDVLVPVFGPHGEVYATDRFATDTIFILRDSLLPPPTR